MNTNDYRHIYGPVPSRRLGRSLGVDLIPFKICSFDCIYCQLGRTVNKTLERKHYVAAGEVLTELERKLAGEDNPDYISLAGSGEPTLNIGLKDLILKIKNLTRIPVAVLTNGSLLWMEEVREALAAADLVLPSLDAGDDRLFQYVNRPHKDITFDLMVEGIEGFTKYFPGEVWLEVLLTGGVTGTPVEAEKIAALVRRIGPARVQLNTVIRPPAENYALTLSREQLVDLKKFFPGRVEIISNGKQDTGHYSTLFATGKEDGDILEMLSRRPCTALDMAGGLGIHPAEVLKRLEGMVAAGKIKTVTSGEGCFYTIKPGARGENAGREGKSE